MASVDLDNLSDSEIRSKLVELGQVVGPVTGTTRKLYLKKLKILLNQSQSSIDLNSSARFDPRNISHSSAEEESDENSSRITRRSMPPPRTNKSPKRKSPTRATASNEPIANSTFKEQKTSVKETFVSYNSPATESNFESRRSTRSSVGLNNSATSQGIYGDDESEQDTSLPRSGRPLLSQGTSSNYSLSHSPPKFSSPDLGSGLSDAFKSRLQASGLSSYTSSYTSPRLNSSNQPYASDFVRKLSANRSGSGLGGNTSSISSKLLDVKESDDEDSGSAQVYTRFTQGGRSSLRGEGQGKGGTLYNDGWLPFDSPISAILLLSFSVFFIAIGFTYINMHSTDTSLSSPTDLHYPICSGSDSHIPKVNCIREVDKELTGKIFKIIYSELHERLKKSPCSHIGDGPFGMSDIDLQAAVLEHDPALGTWITQQQLPNVKILITANPKLKLADISGGIAILNPPLPFYCYITNNLLLAANWVVKSLLVVGLLSALYFGIRFWMMKEASHKQEVYKLANSIIEIIASRGPDSFVPITHVRDQLIPPQDRSKMEKLWNAAVEILNSDSRVRCEQQVVEGEHCLAWRWVASSYSNKRKTWQGQAFDTMEGSVNSLPNSPTSCLKIRHMFDAALEEGDDWVGTVVDAILEKTREARILHIAVERQSREGCVYMKCASPTDAGIAYRALHGSWFDSKLVTVKYIREARYLERFPESAKCTQPLYPSNESHSYFK